MLRNKNIFKLLSLTLGFLAGTCFAKEIDLAVHNSLGNGTPITVVNNDTGRELFTVADGSNKKQKVDDSSNISVYAGRLPIILKWCSYGDERTESKSENVRLSNVQYLNESMAGKLRIFVGKNQMTGETCGWFD